MNIDKEKLKGLLWAETASWSADCSGWKLASEALDEFLGEKTIEEVALELLTENESLRKEVALDDKIIAGRDRLLNMFECPDHGQCIPYAMEQVEALRKDAERYEWICANACDLNFYAAGPAPIRGRVEIDAEQYPVSEWGSAKPELDSIIDAAMGKGEQS